MIERSGSGRRETERRTLRSKSVRPKRSQRKRSPSGTVLGLGDEVKVREDVDLPRLGWRHGQDRNWIGTIVAVESPTNMLVKFPKMNWYADPKDLELVTRAPLEQCVAKTDFYENQYDEPYESKNDDWVEVAETDESLSRFSSYVRSSSQSIKRIQQMENGSRKYRGRTKLPSQQRIRERSQTQEKPFKRPVYEQRYFDAARTLEKSTSEERRQLKGKELSRVEKEMLLKAMKGWKYSETNWAKFMAEQRANEFYSRV